MKKKFLVPALLLMSATAFGQTQFAPEIGVTMYNQTWKSKMLGTKFSQTTDLQPGLRIGGVADITIADHFSVQPGIFYNLNRTKLQNTTLGIETVSKYTMHAIQVPIYFLYKSGTEGEGRFFAGLGPNITYNIAGNVKSKVTALGASVEDDRKLKFGGDASDDMKPFNVGGSVTAGYELPSGLYFRGSYNMGLMNMLPKGDSDNSLKDMSFGLSVGFFLK